MKIEGAYIFIYDNIIYIIKLLLLIILYYYIIFQGKEKYENQRNKINFFMD